ncbi:MAG: GNAT family N-acetyltransferase [Calothrix sp. FI2-JRJ7]|jgi:ribosomal protein S18 acetylase RimI-like enzyme|nr:GNAT family N-acetyltransferase [Calothrix sp. FI2-JRJ7]
MSYIIRPFKPGDEAFLWEMLYQALYVPPGANLLPREIIYSPELSKYVQDWQKEDVGFVAVLESTQIQAGAVWIRLFNNNNQGYGYLNDETPELSIAVLPEYRQQGIGTQLIVHLLENIKNLYPAISLSVSLENPALRLYQRLGFEIVHQVDNSLTMKKELK